MNMNKTTLSINQLWVCSELEGLSRGVDPLLDIGVDYIDLTQFRANRPFGLSASTEASKMPCRCRSEVKVMLQLKRAKV